MKTLHRLQNSSIDIEGRRQGNRNRNKLCLSQSEALLSHYLMFLAKEDLGFHEGLSLPNKV